MRKVDVLNKKSRWGITLAVIFVLASFFFLADTNRFGFQLPKKEKLLVSINNAANGNTGSRYVLNNSGYELLRLNSENKVDLVIKGGNSSEKGFACARLVEEDDEGNIYVHDVIPSEDAVTWYGRERILLFDKNGRFEKIVYDDTYEIPSLRYHIIALQNVDGVIYAIRGTESGLDLLNLSDDSVTQFPFENADAILSCAVYYQPGNCLYACRKNGDLLRMSEEGTEVLMAGSESELGSDFFGAVSVDQEGRVLFCGINTGVVQSYQDGEVSYVFENQMATTTLDCTNGYLFNEYSDIAIADEYDGEAETYESLNLSVGMRLIYLLQIVSWVILGAVVLYCLFLGVKALLKAGSRAKSILAISFVIAGASLGFCAYVYNQLQSISKEDIIERELLSARLVNEAVSGEDFLSIQEVSDFRSPEYMRIKASTDRIILDNGTVPGDLYLMMYTFEDGILYVRFSSEESYGCKYYYMEADPALESQIMSGEAFIMDESREVNGIFQSTYYPKTDENGEVIGVIEVGTDLTFLEKRIKDSLKSLLLSIAAVAVVFVLITLEVIELIDKRKNMDRAAVINGTAQLPVGMYRIAVFLIFFVTNITTPFLSIYALSISQTTGFFGRLSPEIQAAIPISAEVFAGAVFSLLGGGIIEKLGARKAGLLGSVIFVAGLVVRFIYPTILVLTIGNLVQGAGWGIVLLIVNSRIAAESDDAVREQGFTDYTIGLQNGINSGVVFGGFLLGLSNYSLVFAVSAALSVGVLIFAISCIYNNAMDSKKEVDESTSRTGMVRAYTKFLLSPKVIGYFLLIIFPVISASYYLNYMYPIVADGIGMAEDMIGYSFLLNGMVMICFGNILVKFASRYFHRPTQLMLASLIYTVMFALVGFIQNVATLLISLVLMAVTCSVGQVAQTTFYSELKEAEELGYDRAMGVYSLFENLAQTLGSFIFGYILTVGMAKGLTAYGVIIGGMGVLFWVLIKALNKRKVRG